MARKAEVEQYGFAVRAQDHVFGLEVEVIHVLDMHAVHRVGERGANAGDCWWWQRRTLDHLAQAFAFDSLHRNVRRLRQVARSDKARHMRPGQGRQDHLLDFEALDADGRFARPDAWRLDHHWKPRLPAAVLRRAVDVTGAAFVNPLANAKAVDQGTRLQACVHGGCAAKIQRLQGILPAERDADQVPATRMRYWWAPQQLFNRLPGVRQIPSSTRYASDSGKPH
jgi:hypothetical protein